MAKPSDPNFEMDDYNAEMDPFADEAEGAEEEAGDDPFDFEPAPAPKAAARPANPAPKAPPPAARPAARPPAPPPAAANPVAKPEHKMAGVTADVPVQLVAVMGKKTMTIREIISMAKGQVIELNRFPNEAIDLVANGKLMAKGELVEIDGKLGVRIIKIFE